jgi:hypothetical protein
MPPRPYKRRRPARLQTRAGQIVRNTAPPSYPTPPGSAKEKWESLPRKHTSAGRRTSHLKGAASASSSRSGVRK